jgi:hypothetical protein
MLDGMAECQRSTQTALWLADGSIERLLMQVIDASAIVPAVVHRREAESGELGEKLPRLLPMDDPAEGGVLARTQTPACSMTVTRNRAWRSVKPPMLATA